MNIGQAISACMGKYATFSGRATRSEFWWFWLFTVLVSWIASIILSLVFPYNTVVDWALSTVIWLGLLLPTLAVGARRLHDTDRSGWWQLLYITIIGVILLIIWWVFDTQQETNKYGDVPG